MLSDVGAMMKMTKREMALKGNKPHIWFAPGFGIWICAGRSDEGYGDTPAEAYESWVDIGWRPKRNIESTFGLSWSKVL